MGTVPTGILEKELRKLYLKWIGGLPNAANIGDYVDEFKTDSLNLIQSTGADIAALGALIGFPAPKWLDLSTNPDYIFDEMKMAAIQAGIASGLNAKDIAKQMLNAGMDTSYSKLERLARTETTNAYWKNQWDSADGLGLVMVWSAEGGSRTCDWCLNNDGLVVDDDSIRDHPNGRCTLIPMLPEDVKYRGTLRPDGSAYSDPKWGKAHKAPKEDKEDKPEHSSVDYRKYEDMSGDDKIKAAEVMYGTGSKQHQQAIKKWGKAPKTKAPNQNVLTKEEADRWSEGSAFTQEFFHGTSPKAADSIRAQGFSLGQESYGRLWGNGVYLTENYSTSQMYDSGALLKTRVKVMNPIEAADIWTDPVYLDAMDYVAENFPGLSQVKAEAQTITEYARLKNADAIIKRGKDGSIDELIVLDPKAVKVVDS